jgi:hypothetical protein
MPGGSTRPGADLRLPGVRAHGPGGYAGAAGPVGEAGPDLRGNAGSGPSGRAGGQAQVLDSTPLYDAVATMDTLTLVRSAIRGLLRACDGELAGQLRGVLCCAAMTTTLPRESRPVITTTRRRGKHWWMRWPKTLMRCWLAGSWTRRWDKLPSCCPPDRPGPGAGRGRGVPDRPQGRRRPGDLCRRSAGPARSRLLPAGSTAIRGTSRSTLTRRSSPPPRPRRETAGTPRSLRACSVRCSPVIRTCRSPGRRAARGPRRGRGPAVSTAMPPTAPVSSSGGWTTPASITASNASRRPRSKITSPRTASPSTWTARPSPARPASPCPSGPPPGGTPGPPGSAQRAGPARWPPSKPPPKKAARSPSARTRPAWPPPGRSRLTRPGRRTTGPPGPRSSARSAT